MDGEVIRFRKLGIHELGRPSLEAYRCGVHRPIVVLLDSIRSLQNVGAIFRTADAFCIQELALCGFTGAPPHRELHKAALGAEDSVSWRHFADSLEALHSYRAAGFRVLALEQCVGSVSLQDYSCSLGERVLLMVGNEVQGLGQELASAADVCLEIPQFGTKHSLNVATAAGIALWHLCSPYV